MNQSNYSIANPRTTTFGRSVACMRKQRGRLLFPLSYKKNEVKRLRLSVYGERLLPFANGKATTMTGSSVWRSLKRCVVKYKKMA